MTEQDVARHLAKRQKRAEEIIVSSSNFKVCDQCRSISYLQAANCVVCGAYRFDSRPEVVRSTAKEMGGHPFPISTGTVPRL